MFTQSMRIYKLLLAGILVGSIFVTSVRAQSPAPSASKPATRSHSRYQPSQFPKREQLYYELNWGVDSLFVRAVESGELLRFSYRVIDAAKAKQLNEKKDEPALYCARARVKLVIPSLEKVGQLRQTATPETGKSYWMAFSNKGRLVRPGDLVSVVIGKFRVDGLVVQ